MAKHKNSKIITIFQAGSFLSRAQQGGVGNMFEDAVKSIGSYWTSTTAKTIGNNLTEAEIKLLLPKLVGVGYEHSEFIGKVREFFIELSTGVPYNGGIKLEIGLTGANSKPVGENNLPVEPMDYIRYKHAAAHPDVAASKEEADSNPNKRFYIFDANEEKNKSSKKNKEKDAAMKVYFDYKDDPKKVEMMLVLMGVNMKTFEGDDEKAKLHFRDLAEKKPDQINAIFASRDIEYEYTIKDMVEHKVLKQIGNKYLIFETNDLIGNSLEETVLYFKDDTKSDQVTALKATLQEKKK